MKSEQKIIEARKDYAEGLKELVAFANKSENISPDEETELMDSIKGGLILVQTLDWILSDEDLDFEVFCNKNKKDVAEEFGFGLGKK